MALTAYIYDRPATKYDRRSPQKNAARPKILGRAAADQAATRAADQAQTGFAVFFADDRRFLRQKGTSKDGRQKTCAGERYGKSLTARRDAALRPTARRRDASAPRRSA